MRENSKTQKLQNSKVPRVNAPRELKLKFCWREVSSIRGQSLFEVVIAIGVVGIIIVGIVALASTSIRNSAFSRNNSLATRYSQEAIEWLRGRRDTDWVTFHNNAVSSAIYCFDSLAWSNLGACSQSETITGTILRRQVAFTNIQPAQITAEILVIWQDSQGTHQVSTSTVFTDWRSR